MLRIPESYGSKIQLASFGEATVKKYSLPVRFFWLMLNSYSIPLSLACYLNIVPRFLCGQPTSLPQFLATMSHEMRTPLNVILGMNALVMDLPLSEEQHVFSEQIRAASESLLFLINDILDLAKVRWIGRSNVLRKTAGCLVDGLHSAHLRFWILKRMILCCKMLVVHSKVIF